MILVRFADSVKVCVWCGTQKIWDSQRSWRMDPYWIFVFSWKLSCAFHQFFAFYPRLQKPSAGWFLFTNLAASVGWSFSPLSHWIYGMLPNELVSLSEVPSKLPWRGHRHPRWLVGEVAFVSVLTVVCLILCWWCCWHMRSIGEFIWPFIWTVLPFQRCLDRYSSP